MVKIIESQRQRVGIAGRRKRPNRDESYVYYTSSDGRTILANDNNEMIVDADDAESPLATTALVSTSTVTPSFIKPSRRNVRPRKSLSILKRHDYMDASDSPLQEQQPTAKTDTSVQVSIDDDDNKLNDINDNARSSLLGNEIDSNTIAMQEERIEFLSKQLQEKDVQIEQLQQSQTPSVSPVDTIEQTNRLLLEAVTSLKLQLEEMKQNQCSEIAQLQTDVSSWKEKASDLALELERATKYNTSRNVYNGHFLLGDSIATTTEYTTNQNELPVLAQSVTDGARKNSCTTLLVAANGEPQLASTTWMSQRNKKHTTRFASQTETTNVNPPGIKQPLVSPRSLTNVTYLGKPLSFQHHVDAKAKFQLMVLSPNFDTDDDDSDKLL